MTPEEPVDVQQVAALLGGTRTLHHKLRTRLDAHEMLVEGMPGQALHHLIDRLSLLGKTASMEQAVGMSLRTFQRRREEPARPLSLEQGGRVWKFAEILTRAAAVFGSLEEAELWLERPAIGLDQRRPITLLATPAGLSIVEDFLLRLEFGVYA